jgi:XTP/dITP diphosphohydrolase
MKKELEFILASHNTNKVKEINLLLKNTAISVKSLAEINYHDDIIEDGSTIEENAQIKASTIFKKFQLPAIGEDTGLEVLALNNRPGVFTARYGGSEKDADKNMDKVLAELEMTNDRRARFRTCIWLKTENEEKLFEGIVNGKISLNKKGAGGFGYDPIFIPEGYKKTFAELPLSEKSKISHRARAIKKLIDYLQALY